MSTSAALILVLNSGSSSIKIKLYRMGEGETLLRSGELERIGLDGGRFRAADGKGVALIEEKLNLPDHTTALRRLFTWLQTQELGGPLTAVGHRVVHGGARYRSPQRLDDSVLTALRQLIPLSPLHLPSEIAAIEAVWQFYPGIAQVACFDTAFHGTLPEVAWHLPLPRRWTDLGIRRYGFHGLSYEYVLEELRNRGGPGAAQGKIVVAHLGNGASMAAIRDGQGIDTTMSFTPTAGLVMGTRTGDLDPGVVLYLLREQGLSVAEVDRLVNHESGLLGVSGVSPDMRELTRRRESDASASLAVDLFCYQARKFIGALTAALEGLDTLVFTAGIGEHAVGVRAQICAGLGYLGVVLDARRNEENAALVSAEGSRVTVRVIPTNEEIMIARQTSRLLAGAGTASVPPG